MGGKIGALLVMAVVSSCRYLPDDPSVFEWQSPTLTGQIAFS